MSTAGGGTWTEAAVLLLKPLTTMLPVGVGGAAMLRTIRARFSNGVFEPLEPKAVVGLHEGDEVLLTVSAFSVDATDPFGTTAGSWKGLVDGEALKSRLRTPLGVVGER
jgi:predicted DNA-binding antitoxin AbrB/MazE fold protein